jgi:transcriptional regulator with XRE-family HTH domain
MSILDMATKAGVSRQAVYNWEKGVKTPSVATLYKLADILSVDIAYFFTNENRTT